MLSLEDLIHQGEADIEMAKVEVEFYKRLIKVTKRALRKNNIEDAVVFIIQYLDKVREKATRKIKSGVDGCEWNNNMHLIELVKINEFHIREEYL